MMPLAGSNAVYTIATRKFSASEQKARSAAENWERLLEDEPQSEGRARYNNGICHVDFIVATNDAAILEALTQDAFCNRPAAILTRVVFDNDPEQSKSLSTQAHQYLLDAFVKRNFAVIDVSEQTELFREPIRESQSCAYVGGTSSCEVREYSLSESILEILRNADLIIQFYNDDNIGGDKYLPLAQDGVLNFVTISVAPARSQLVFTATANSYKVSDRDIAWAVPPQTIRLSTRARTEEDVLGTAFNKIAEKIALESALRCTGQ
tara:strand:+ start:2594 stop:3388 length:795 start_codon:yes stop_codon:yes gene_type:complete